MIAILANQMEKLQELSQSELQELLDNTERVESMALESDEVNVVLRCYFSVGKVEIASIDTNSVNRVFWKDHSIGVLYPGGVSPSFQK